MNQYSWTNKQTYSILKWKAVSFRFGVKQRRRETSISRASALCLGLAKHVHKQSHLKFPMMGKCIIILMLQMWTVKLRVDKSLAQVPRVSI